MARYSATVNEMVVRTTTAYVEAESRQEALERLESGDGEDTGWEVQDHIERVVFEDTLDDEEVAEPVPFTGPLTCPNGHAGPFRYVERISCWRDVVGVNAEGVLEINGLYLTGEGYDEDGSDGYLECHGSGPCTNPIHDNPGIECDFQIGCKYVDCLDRFPIPEGLEVDWV